MSFETIWKLQTEQTQKICVKENETFLEVFKGKTTNDHFISDLRST